MKAQAKILKELMASLPQNEIHESIVDQNQGRIGGTIRDKTEHEMFSLGSIIFDVEDAIEYCDGEANDEVEVNRIWNAGVNLDPKKAMNSKSTAPLLIAQVPTANGPEMILIDGHHRMYKAVAEGQDKLPAFIFTPQETLGLIDCPPQLYEILEQNLAMSSDDSPESEEQEQIEKQGSGVMVCLYLPDEIARSICLNGGEPAESLHVTLAYIPGIAGNEDAFDAICDAVDKVCDRFGPVSGSVGGIGLFNASESSDYRDVYYASYNSPVLPALREAVVTALEDAGFVPNTKHGFTPHITLKYLAAEEGMPNRRPYTMPFEVPCLSIASRSLREDVLLVGNRVLKAQPSAGSVHVNAPLGGKKKRTDQIPLSEESVVKGGEGSGPQEGSGSAPKTDSEHEQKIKAAEKKVKSAERSANRAQNAHDDNPTDKNKAKAERAHNAHAQAHQEHAEALTGYMNHLKAKIGKAEGDDPEEDDEDQKLHDQLDRSTPGWDPPPENNQEVGLEKDGKKRPIGKSDLELANWALRETLSEKKEIPILKAMAKKQIVYGVVLEPDTEDGQEDVMTAEEIERTAHLYLQNCRNVGRRHKAVIQSAYPVESYIAPMDMHFAGGPYGDSVVKKGSWVLGVKIPDVADWKKVESGEYTAFSVGGFGVRD